VLIEATAPAGAPDPTDLIAELIGDSLEAGLAEDAVIAASEAQAERFWRIRHSISEAEKKQGLAAKHDVSVPVDAMPEFIMEASAAVEARFPGSHVIAFGHLGDGNVHFNVAAPADSGMDWLETEAPAVSAFVHDLTIGSGGSISAEHGIGQMRLSELARLESAASLGAKRAIKNALDPHGIMNPGKLVPLA
jgi:FAD/FMN-containing dehydrogenase